MIAYIFGAGASAHAQYPLASKLLPKLSDWLDVQDPEQPGIRDWRTRIAQLRSTFGSLDNFEDILGRLDELGFDRVKGGAPNEYPQCTRDTAEDALRSLSGRGPEEPSLDETPPGYYPQNLRDDLVSAVREFFRFLESGRTEKTAYDRLAQRASADDTFITFNYDVALECALGRAKKWDVGSGYGFSLFAPRPKSQTTVFKLHGSVNWFQHPLQEELPPVLFPRDLELLGHTDLRDSRVGEGGCAVNNSGTLILPDPKKRFLWEQLWCPLWDSAAQRLQSAREVFIHGYSLPKADTRARDFLFKNINSVASISVFCRSASEDIADDFRRNGFKNVSSDSAVDFESWST